MDIINKRTLEKNNVGLQEMFQRTTERGGVVGNLKSYDYLQTQRETTGDRMSCHYLNIVIIKMYINNMFCAGSLQLIEPQLELRE